MSSPRGFVRTDVDAEEEITPPTTQRFSSFESLSAATALCSQLPASIAPALAYDAPPRSEAPGSPTVVAAAAMLQQVQATDSLEGAVDCLMLMSSHAAASAETGHMPPPKKRPPPATSSTRRKLKMRTGPSPLSRGATYDERSTMQPLALLSSSSVDQVRITKPRPQRTPLAHFSPRPSWPVLGRPLCFRLPLRLTPPPCRLVRGSSSSSPPPSSSAPRRQRSRSAPLPAASTWSQSL